jgi:hypothetical protein
MTTKRKKATAKQLLNVPVTMKEFTIRTYSALEVLCDTFHAHRELTIRDLFALAALQGDAQLRAPADKALYAYMVADQMLKQRPA